MKTKYLNLSIMLICVLALSLSDVKAHPDTQHETKEVPSRVGAAIQSSAGLTERVSVASDGTPGIGSSNHPSISGDGRYVAFWSESFNLVSGDANERDDIFLHDMQTGQTELISIASDGTQANAVSSEPSISGDGRYVAFFSHADNLVPGDLNNFPDIFVHDRQTGETMRASVASDGTQSNNWSNRPSISSNGRYVAFDSSADNLVPGDTPNHPDVFVHDRQTGQTEIVSVAGDGTQGNGGSGAPSMSSDGRYVAFSSMATNLVSEPDTNGGLNDVFVHDRQTGQTVRVSEASDGTSGNGDSGSASISANGRFVAFWSYSSNLVNGDTNSSGDVFVKDRQTGVTERVSVATDGQQGNNHSGNPAISSTGRYVGYWSMSDNLVSNDTNYFCDLNGDYDYSDNCDDLFLHDRQTGNTIRVSVASNGTEGNGSSKRLSISENGGFVAFDSFANNLVDGDTNLNQDVFVRIYLSNISGMVTYGDDSPISNVTLSAGGGNVTTTNGSGEYTFLDLAPGTHTLIPSKSGHSFSPASIEITVPSDANNVDFVGGISISGDTTHGDGSTISGVTISAGSGILTTTNNSGGYALQLLAPGTYSLVPSKTNYSFSPASIEITVPPEASEVDFVGGLTISGYVTHKDHSPIPGASISDGSVLLTTTDENGFYKIEHLAPEICYVTPSKGGYEFSPTSIEVIVPPNVNDINFEGIGSLMKTFIPMLIK